MSVRILLVEDTADLRRLFARVLRRGGFEVCEAADGREALELVLAFLPEVVITDLMMPVVDGYELIRRLRAMSDFADVPVLAMTAAATGEAERDARAAGAGIFLTKPLDGRTLLDRVGEACRQG